MSIFRIIQLVAPYYARVNKGLQTKPLVTMGGGAVTGVALSEFLDSTDEQIEQQREEAADQANEIIQRLSDIATELDSLNNQVKNQQGNFEELQDDIDSLEQQLQDNSQQLENLIEENFERRLEETTDDKDGGGGSDNNGDGSGGGGSGDGSGDGGGAGSSKPNWLEINFPFLFPFESPIVLDLNGNNTIDYVNLNESIAYFDLNNDDFAEHTGWITGGDGFLVRDNNGDGIINNQSELFGVENGVSGYSKLGALDSNGDNVIDANDAEFTSLQAWIDENEDGFSQPWELHSLSDLDIATIGLEVNAVPEENQQLGDGLVTETSYFIFADGTTKQTADVFFNNDQINSLYTGDVELNEAVLNIPYVRGFGSLPDLPIAASLDGSLLQTTQELLGLNPTNSFAISLTLDTLLYQWAGSVGNNPQNDLRQVDERKLGFLESLVVQDANLEDGLFFDGGFSEVGKFYDIAKSNIVKGLLIEGIYAEQFSGIEYNPFSDEVIADATQLDNTITALEAIEPATASERAVYWSLLYPTLAAAQENAQLANFDTRIDNAIAGSGLTLDDLQNQDYSIIFTESTLDGVQGNDGNEVIILTDVGGDVNPDGGSDLTYWGNGDADYTLSEFGSEADVDTVHVELDEAQVELTPSGQDLKITNTDTGSILTIDDFFTVADGNNPRSVERIVFNDTSYTNVDLITGLNTPGANNDILTGSEQEDLLTLTGGNDVARGYGASDQYNVYANGNHTINDFAGNSTAFTDSVTVFDASPEEVTVTAESNDIVLNFGADTSLRLENQLLDNGIGKIEQVGFDSDPSIVWTADDLRDMV